MRAYFTSLRHKIQLILLLAVLPLAALPFYLAVDESREAVERARADQKAAVHLVSLEVNRVIQDARDLLVGFGRNPDFLKNPIPCAQELAALHPSFPQFFNMAAVDLNRKIICAAYNPENLRTTEWSRDDMDLLARVQSSHGVEIGTARINAWSRPVIPLLGPVLGGDGVIKSYFFVSVDLQWLNSQVNSIHVPEGAILLVIDRAGLIVSRSPPSAEWTLARPAPAYERTLPGSGVSHAKVRGESDVDRLYWVEPVESGAGLTVVSKVRVADIYGRSRLRLMLHLGLLAAVGCAVLGLTWIGSRRYVTRPLTRLIETADCLAAGDLSARAGMPYTGEFGTVAHAFDSMAGALQRERSKTARTSEAFREIVQGISGTTGEEFFCSLVSCLCSVLKAHSAYVGEWADGGATLATLALCINGDIVPNRTLGPGSLPDGPHRLSSPLLDENGKELALMGVICEKPLSEDFVDPQSMLNILAARASAELKRLRAESELRGSMAGIAAAAERHEEMVRTLQSLMGGLESVREEERTRIAREIHDELGQKLTAIRFEVMGLQTGSDRAGLFSGLIGLVDSTIKDVRRIATELRPVVLDTFGLIAAIQWLAEDFGKRTGIPCVYEGPDAIAPDRELSTAVFRICQESLTNVARHARATEVRIRLQASDEWLLLEISDNGAGVSSEVLANTKSLGILGMRERARIAGGDLTIRSVPGEGFTISARLRLRAGRRVHA